MTCLFLCAVSGTVVCCAKNEMGVACRPDITYFLDGEEAVEDGLPAFTLTKFN